MNAALLNSMKLDASQQAAIAQIVLATAACFAEKSVEIESIERGHGYAYVGAMARESFHGNEIHLYFNDDANNAWFVEVCDGEGEIKMTAPLTDNNLLVAFRYV